MASSPRTQIQKKYYSLKKNSQNSKKEMQRSTCGTITLNKFQLLTREFIEVEGKYLRICLFYELILMNFTLQIEETHEDLGRYWYTER